LGSSRARSDPDAFKKEHWLEKAKREFGHDPTEAPPPPQVIKQAAMDALFSEETTSTPTLPPVKSTPIPVASADPFSELFG